MREGPRGAHGTRSLTRLPFVQYRDLGVRRALALPIQAGKDVGIRPFAQVEEGDHDSGVDDQSDEQREHDGAKL